jgi:SAM-dependent methyltransferase
VDYQDVLAELGAGSAHPGGYESTQQWLSEIPWDKSMSVLDVGCGTGRTLLQVNQRYGCKIVGVDVRKKMIQKAKKRADRNAQVAQWEVASAERLPFPNESFDVVYTESVNVFVNYATAIKEYHRVLKPDGWYVDVEMLVVGPTDERWRESVSNVYGAKAVPDQRGWKQRYKNAGFGPVRVLFTRPVKPFNLTEAEQNDPEEIDLVSPGAYQNPSVVNILRLNSEWLETHHRALGYGVFLMRKESTRA